MSALLMISLIAAIPLVWSVVNRVSATYLFIGVVVGNLFVHQFSDDGSLVVASVMHSVDTTLIANIALQFIPVILILLFARHTLTNNNLAIHIIPLLFTCVMLAILSLQLVPAIVATAWYDTAIGQQTRQAEGLVIGVTAAMQLLLILLSRQPRPHKPHKSKH